MWEHGNILYEAKVFDTGSQFGINGGRVSKLHVVKDGKCIINYDRGWDIRPATQEDERILNLILELYREE